MDRKPKDVRIAVGLSAVKAGKLAGTSRQTVRLYEIDPNEVEPEQRAALDAVYADLRALLASRSVPPPHAA